MDTKKQTLQSKAFPDLFAKLCQRITPQDMKKLCEVLNITQEFPTTIDFICYLKKEEKFTEDNVDDFVEALITANLMALASEVHKYVERAELVSTVDFERIKVGDDVNTSCMEHQQPLELFCNPCNKQICFECAFHQHRGKNHIVLNENEIEAEIEKCKTEITSMLSDLQQNVQETRSTMSNLKYLARDRHQRFVSAHFDHWISQTEQHEKVIKDMLRLHVEKQEGKLSSFKANIVKFSQTLSMIKDKFQQTENTEIHKPSKIRQLNLWKKEIVTCKKEIEAEMDDFETNVQIAPSFKPLPLHGNIIDTHPGSVVGALSISEQVAVIVRDERHYGKGVTFSCVSSKDHELFWVYEVSDFNDKYPIVMAGCLFETGGKHSKVLIANGSFLRVITIGKEDIKSIEEVAKIKITFEEGCYATAMTLIISGNKSAGVLVASNKSTMVTRLNEEFEYVARLDCSAYVHSISSLACVDNNILVIDSSRNEAAILVECGRVNLLGKLRAPMSSTEDMKPKFAQWDGSYWGVVWESLSGGTVYGPSWQHATYLRSGDECSSNMKGQCQPFTELVSLSFCRAQSLVCFTNGKVQTFETTT